MLKLRTLQSSAPAMAIASAPMASAPAQMDPEPEPRQEKEDVPASAIVSSRHGMSRLQASLIIMVLTGISSLNTLGSGVLTISLPAIARDIGLDEALLLWPPSVYALAAGCTLLIFGAVSDVVGPRPVWLTGAAMYGAFTLGVGLCRTASQLIAFRTVLGLAIAMCLPAAVSLTTQSFLPGRWRNMAFAFQGMGQPLGYSLGLILGGVFTDTIGWRWAYYISLIINTLLVICAVFVLPGRQHDNKNVLARLRHDTDWVGALTLSSSLGILSYVLASISKDYQQVKLAYNIVLLVLGILLLPAFVLWVGYRERNNLPALVPNSLWKNAVFSTTCITVFVTWAVFNAFQYFGALYFERVVHTTALEASIRFLPMVFVGAGTNIVTGFLVDKVEVGLMVSITAAINVVPPLLMALSTPSRGYWRGDFFAMLLSPLHPDVLFTVSNLIIAKAYPGKSQSLAGAVFNAVSQIGNSVGLAVTAAIASSLAQRKDNSEEGLLDGYHAAFWTMFAAMAIVVPITYFGLRRGGKVGATD
ncbi:hypothetical protein JX265_010130 [Neoarthrinium moseri]|uniref:Major facilitator superfamily (MFS) profile domain-containing protein n=1 Tax=Neoarthrinium moseri TaxID=1658444 RepID=A0A9P9WEQ9_9PEZI|nr:uncharacterized protein JN550_006831 [Neoarthrinium moseri]KAI1841257.1 hypothetical protein JX266_012569 [Neoarthrinium moseri]KAI1860206.1 hypothetical protein JX265_010130 [Neoarthrinium moseri]KAI1867690.1 hypothetical protein JN550_006831 [Neoarthrinium moseri]